MLIFHWLFNGLLGVGLEIFDFSLVLNDFKGFGWGNVDFSYVFTMVFGCFCGAPDHPGQIQVISRKPQGGFWDHLPLGGEPFVLLFDPITFGTPAGKKEIEV